MGGCRIGFVWRPCVIWAHVRRRQTSPACRWVSDGRLLSDAHELGDCEPGDAHSSAAPQRPFWRNPAAEDPRRPGSAGETNRGVIPPHPRAILGPQALD
ncbi:hypothetical protein MTO96_011850 [Rhipicephalus appendiculatus]